MDNHRARIIWELTNKLHEQVDSLYEALMEDDTKEAVVTIKELTISINEINKDIKSNGKNVQKSDTGR